jgi:hypothetical protein
MVIGEIFPRFPGRVHSMVLTSVSGEFPPVFPVGCIRWSCRRGNFPPFFRPGAFDGPDIGVGGIFPRFPGRVHSMVLTAGEFSPVFPAGCIRWSCRRGSFPPFSRSGAFDGPIVGGIFPRCPGRVHSMARCRRGNFPPFPRPGAFDGPDVGGIFPRFPGRVNPMVLSAGEFSPVFPVGCIRWPNVVVTRSQFGALCLFRGLFPFCAYTAFTVHLRAELCGYRACAARHGSHWGRGKNLVWRPLAPFSHHQKLLRHPASGHCSCNGYFHATEAAAIARSALRS